MDRITNIDEFQQNIRSCIELRIQRSKLGYYHHVFVGDVDTDGCDLYHYKSKSSLSFVSFPPAQITKVRLQYKTHNTCSEILSIFNFNRGDTVEIVDRRDYPTTDQKRKECIKKAKSRLGETQYTASFNNCESYVNWIFSNDNSSEQASKSLLNYLLTLMLDELSLKKVITFLFDDVLVIVTKINAWIEKMLGKIDTYLKCNLEKYWNKFEKMIEKIAEKFMKKLQIADWNERYLQNYLLFLKINCYLQINNHIVSIFDVFTAPCTCTNISQRIL